MSSQSLSTPYLLLAGSVGVAIIAVFAAFQPMLIEIQDTQAQIDETQVTLIEKETFLRTLDSKLADLELNKSHEERLNLMLPQEDRMEDALRILHVAATQSGTTVEQVGNTTGAAQAEVIAEQARGGNTALPATVSPLGVSLDVSGSYQAIRNFLGQLETTPRLMDITRVNLRLNEETSDLINAQFAVRFYRLKENSSPAL